MMHISLIFAIDQNNAIGNNNSLPWHLPADLKRFKDITMGHHIIMGRKTHESIGKALPGRTNVVISRRTNYTLPGDIVVKPSLPEAIAYAREQGEDEVFIIGGASVFQEALGMADRFYLTRIHHSFEADTFLPRFEDDGWELVENETFDEDIKNAYRYSFITLQRTAKATKREEGDQSSSV